MNMEADLSSLDNLLDCIVERLADKLSSRLRDDIETVHDQQHGNDLIFKQDAMDKYHFSASTAYRWQQKGQVKPYKIGRKVFYREGDIRRAMGLSSAEEPPQIEQ